RASSGRPCTASSSTTVRARARRTSPTHSACRRRPCHACSSARSTRGSSASSSICRVVSSSRPRWSSASACATRSWSRPAAAAAAYFEKIARNGMRIGLSCGFTLYQTIRQLHERRFRDLALYPLSGESTLELVDLFPNTLVGMMAAKYRPHVQAWALPVQHLLSLSEIERERRPLLRDPAIRRIYEAAQDVDIALVGIGLISEGTPGFCSLAESYGVSVKRLRQLGVVGEINYQPFDEAGRIVDRPELRALMRRVLSV